MGFKVI